MPFCPKCGTSNPDGARFCQSCGAPVPAVTGSTAAPGAPPPPPPGPPPAAAPGQHGYGAPGYGAPGYPPPGAAAPIRRKNPNTAAAWGLLWGFGAQAFYNGQPMKAIAQILVNFLVVWRMIQSAAWTGGQGAAWFLGLAIAAIFMADGYRVAKKINAGVHVGPWTFF
jgi:TM2 domain-containing membrane protein YozV